MQQRRLASCRIASTVAAAPAVIIAWTSVARRSAGSVSSCTNARSMALRASLRETPTRRASASAARITSSSARRRTSFRRR
jgi:hypothetical protein